MSQQVYGRLLILVLIANLQVAHLKNIFLPSLIYKAAVSILSVSLAYVIFSSFRRASIFGFT